MQVQTVLYRAPEIFFQEKAPTVIVKPHEDISERSLKTYTKKADIWSVGCIMAGT
jgi:serine/threonine protein kinase